MDVDRRRFHLEPLEQRLLLSATGILPDVAAAGAVLPETVETIADSTVDEQISYSDQINTTYLPETRLDDLFDAAPATPDGGPETEPGEPVDDLAVAAELSAETEHDELEFLDDSD